MLSARLRELKSFNKMRLLLSLCLLSYAGIAVSDETTSGHELSSASQLFTWLLSTFAILAIILVVAYLLKKTRFVRNNSGKLVILNQLYLGTKQRVVVVKAKNRQIMLGVTQSQITYLTDLDDEKAEFDKVLEDHSKANTDTENSIEQGSHDISKSN